MIRRIALLFPVLILAACSNSWFGDEEKPPLPGERQSVLQLQQSLQPDAAGKAQPFAAPTAWRNEFWPQAGGYSNHAMQHLQLNAGDLKKIWSADIGAGGTDTAPLTAQPILVDGRIYALDTDSQLSAFDAETGKRIWNVYVGAKDEDDTVLGGGIAFSGGALYVTNGYAEILALKPDDGAEFWRANLPAPARAAPTILDNRVFVVTLDNQLVALDAGDGRMLWNYQGVAESAGLLGAASAAASHDIVIAPFSSGEIFALRASNGSVAWSDNLAPPLRISGASGLSDIRALPVMDSGLVIATSYGGRLAAIDERSGARVWQRDFGGLETPWVAGNRVFAIGADGQLVALSIEDGAVRWVRQLDQFEDMKDRKGPLTWTGPVFAGGRLIAMSSKGHVLELAPDTGDTVRTWKTGKAPAVPVMIANETLYVLFRDGTLAAYR